MDVDTRQKMVDKHRYCVNCLAKSHDMRACPSMDTCKICDEWHHTMLHPSIKSRLSLRTPKVRRSAGATRQQTTATARPPVKPNKSISTSKRERRSVTPPRDRPKPPTASSSGPNKRILSEAIRSLAEVLCVHQD